MESIAAIDIGSTKTLTLIVDVDEKGNTRVVSVGSAPCRGMKRGTVNDIEETAQAVVNSVRRCEQMAGRKINNVVISVTGEHIQGQNSKGIIPLIPPHRTITREDVNRVINHSKQIVLPSDRELIHALPRTFKVDSQDGIERPFGMSGERLEVSTHLVHGQVTHIHNLERCVNRAQIEVDQVVFSPIASGLAVLEANEMESGVLLLDIGGGTTDIALYADGSLAFSGCIPVGSGHVTSDISKLLKTSREEAERLKISSGSCLPENIGKGEVVAVTQLGMDSPRPFPRSVLAEIITARVDEILYLVTEHLEKSGFGLRQVSGCVLTGGGSKLTGLPQMAEKALNGVSVRIGIPKELGGLSDMVSGPEHATAVGLVLHELKMREDKTVSAEVGDWRRFFAPFKTLFGAKAGTNK